MNFEQCASINSRVNALPYRVDAELYERPEFWERISTMGVGDCEDFAIEKLMRLIEWHAWPIRALRLATCIAETGEGHAVLLADPSAQTWVLDNRYAEPMDFRALPYKWMKIQIAGRSEWHYASADAGAVPLA